MKSPGGKKRIKSKQNADGPVSKLRGGCCVECPLDAGERLSIMPTLSTSSAVALVAVAVVNASPNNSKMRNVDVMSMLLYD